MKRFMILWSVLLLMGTLACSDFLNVTPKNVISMDDLESIKQSLGGFLNNITSDRSAIVGKNLPWSPFLDNWGTVRTYATDWDLSKYVEDEFTDSEIRICDWRSTSTQSLWGTYYSPIGFLNLILHEAAKAVGEEEMRDYVMGEAYVMRAYCFFKLLQHFAPYKDNQAGIPLCLETYEDFETVTLERSSQKEVYVQILSDLTEAETRLERTPSRTTYNLLYTPSVVNRLFAEVYHFKALSGAAEADDWKNAAVYAGKETKKYEPVSDPAILKEAFKPKKTDVYSNDECAFLAYTSGSGSSSLGYVSRSLVTDRTFFREYFPEGEGDIRRSLFFRVRQEVEDGVPVEVIDFDKFSGYTGDYDARNYYYMHFGFRLAEAWLIEAEALAMSDQLPQAKEVLKRFKEARYTGNVVVPVTKEALLSDIYRERRKEFVVEMDMRWLDMKRLGISAERTIGGITFTLSGEGDYRYAFPIPEFELKYNKYIDQNPGWILND